MPLSLGLSIPLKTIKVWKYRLTAAACFLLLFSFCPEGSADTIILSDGSSIQAEILTYSNGIYRFRSETLGEFSLQKDKIRSIQPGGKAPTSFSSGDLGLNSPQAREMKQQLMSDPETMKMITNLQNDPSVQKILQDKELMQAIGQGDMNRVGEDPKIRSLMNNKSVGEIIDRQLNQGNLQDLN
ncbi:MAG: hypothetical protein V3U37_06590 [Nitrospinaceae bacterium]